MARLTMLVALVDLVIVGACLAVAQPATTTTTAAVTTTTTAATTTTTTGNNSTTTTRAATTTAAPKNGAGLPALAATAFAALCLVLA